VLKSSLLPKTITCPSPPFCCGKTSPHMCKSYRGVLFVSPIRLAILRRWNIPPELTLLVADGCDAPN
jgi:hypothetical protein